MTLNGRDDCVQLATSDERCHDKTHSSRKKPTESLHASRNVSLTDDTKTCKHEEINAKGKTFNTVKG